MSITELSFLVMFILIMFIINMLIHINNVNSDDYVMINKINYQTQKSMAEKSDEFRQKLVDQISINKKLFDNIAH